MKLPPSLGADSYRAGLRVDSVNPLCLQGLKKLLKDDLKKDYHWFDPHRLMMTDRVKLESELKKFPGEMMLSPLLLLLI